MNEVQKVNLRRTGEWLAEEVQIQVQKKWLVIGAVAQAVLMILALD